MKITASVRLVSRFSFNDDNGRKLEGTRIHYEGSQVNTDTKKGIEELQLTSPTYTAFDDFKVVPGQYEIELEMTPGKNGQVKMVYLSSKLLDK